MPRPKTVDDATVLNSALKAMAEKGTAFTLADVARDVGLSRATLIQRFGDRDAFLVRMAEQELSATRAWLADQPVTDDPDGLWDFLVAIISGMGNGDSFSGRIVIAALEARDPDLRAFAACRYDLVQQAITDRLPADCDRRQVAEHVHSVIAGATMQWLVTDKQVDLPTFVLQRVRWALARLSLWTRD